jgi:hypothetical protein
VSPKLSLHPGTIYAKFGSTFGQAVSEEKIFLTLANQKQELPLAAIFVGGMGRNEETL